MSLSREKLGEKLAALSAEIARQRGDLARAYRDLEKPIHYAEYGLRGFGFLRKNSWVLVAVPAVFSLASSVLGFRKVLKSSGAELRQRQRERELRELRAAPKGFLGHATRVGNIGWKLFKIYRKVRPFFL